MNRIKILLLHKGYSSFVRADYNLLKKHYNVHSYFLKPSKNIFAFFYYHLRFFIFMLFNFRKFDLILTWFGDYHAFNAGMLSKLFDLKHIIIVGGNDAVSIPAISFGVYFKNNFRSKLISNAYKHADAVLCVDDSLILGENTYIEGNNKVGIENFIPGIKEKCEVVPTGYNAEYWKCSSVEKINQVLTIGTVESEQRAVLKGIDLIVQLADRLPEIKFVCIGVDEKIVNNNFKKRKNLTIINKLDQKKLKEYYCNSKVYAQFSVTEGLPNTLCEAMLCECIVVGSNVNGIPKMIRNDELILFKKDVDQAVRIIMKSMSLNKSIGVNNRNFLEEFYSEEIRENALTKNIDNIV